jgi:hypothetical protein
MNSRSGADPCRQLGLVDHVTEDGLVFITSTGDGEDSPLEPNRELLQNLTVLRAEVRALREEVRASRSGETVPAPGPLRLPGGTKSHGEISGGFSYIPRRFRVAH